jgi:hypothetical protein
MVKDRVRIRAKNQVTIWLELVIGLVLVIG